MHFGEDPFNTPKELNPKSRIDPLVFATIFLGLWLLLSYLTK